MSVLVVLTVTTSPADLDDLFAVLGRMTAEAHAQGALRQEVARGPGGDTAALVVSLWPDRSTYEAFAHGPGHEQIAQNVRAVGRGTSLTVADVQLATGLGVAAGAPPDATEGAESPGGELP